MKKMWSFPKLAYVYWVNVNGPGEPFLTVDAKRPEVDDQTLVAIYVYREVKIARVRRTLE